MTCRASSARAARSRSRALDLDYCGVDLAVNAAGDILLFEANAAMVLVPLWADPKRDYSWPAFDKIFAAVHTMLVETAAGGAPRKVEASAYRSCEKSSPQRHCIDNMPFF
jgi:hypothetical protein